MEHIAYLLLGGNLGNRKQNLQQTTNLLSQKAGNVTGISSIYETEPWGFESEKWFYNQVVCLWTNLEPQELLEICLDVERNMGRKSKTNRYYSSRTMDVDILFYDDEIVNDDNLFIPHPKLHKRKFALMPMAELCEKYVHPELGKTVEKLLEECEDDSIVRKKQISNIPYQYIAIEGNIGAGKTSLAKLLSNEWEAELILETFKDNPFLPKFYKNQEKYAFPLEMSFLAERYQQLKAHQETDLFKPITIADYFISKSLIFAASTLDYDEHRLFKQLFKIMFNSLPKPDLLVYLYLDVFHLKKNIQKRGREYEANISDDYLLQLQKNYFNFIKQQTDMRVLVIDTNSIDFVNKTQDYEKIKALLEKDYPIGFNTEIL